ncbi:ERF family protein [Hymenobacter aerilatus]|uniref:ERF family protein n=1 Tax=Hymenobacter aerilatus TaxID=2932251 RepID=A0A8T9SYQ0_9BACT|nr:ERF family protein [Hymenobacter aerilatus]UOR07208.1 ERF family protein [Hymenobacter aerilatus]
MATEKQGLIYAKIAAVMSEVGHIGKNRENQQQRYSFRGIDDAFNALHEPLAKNGVFYTNTVLAHHAGPVPTKSGGQMMHVTITVRYTFFCEDGSFITSEARGEAMDSGTKQRAKRSPTR